MKKSLLSLFLVFSLIFQFFPVFNLNSVSIAQSSQTPNYDGDRFFVKDPYYSLSWSDYKLNNGIPTLTPRTISVKGNTFYFNMELWEDQHIVVYGSYDSLQNEFKNGKGIEDSNGYRVIDNKGYYENGTGEYRFHGFDQTGSKYANNYFPRDAVSSTKASEKKWIYRVWDKTSPFYSNSRVNEPSEFFKVATGERPFDVKTQNKMKEVIKDILPFEMVGTYNNANTDAYNYAHVQSMSTTLFGGEAKMYHYRADLQTKVWYQVFSLEPTTDKLTTPVEATIEVVDKQDVLVGESASVKYVVTVKGTLKDEYMWDNKDSNGVADNGKSDEIFRATYYHRKDIKDWTFTVRDLLTNELRTINGIKTTANTGEATFTITIPYSKYENMVTPETSDLEVNFVGVATSNFNTGDKSSDTAQTSVKGVPVPVLVEPLVIDISAPHEMLDTEKFKLIDNTDLGDTYTRTISLEGVELSESESAKFISGNYTFPFLGRDEVYTYSVKYYDPLNDIEHNYINYIMVYTTRPRAQFKVTGTFKENRLIEAQTDVTNVNSSYLRANATINTDSFNAINLSGDNSLIKFGTQNQNTLAFIVKGIEEIQIQMQVTANINPSKIERSDIPIGYHTSEVFNYRLYTQDDYAPAMIANVWNSTLARNETLDLTYDASSVDNDIISISTYKIYFDANGDKIPETIVKQGDYSTYTPYTPTSLGYYKIVFYAEESFGQPTLSQFITASDKRTATIEREIFVDNLAPMTKLYTDIEYDFPEVDVIVLNDQDITRERNNSIVAERVNWINGLRQSGMSASVQVWDLHTYVYSQDASTTYNSGGSYPPATRVYSSGGYSGTIPRYNVVNNQYQVDNGYYKSVTDSRFETDSRSQSGFCAPGQETPSNIPSSISYSSGGYTGTLGQDSYTYDSDAVYDAKGKYLGYNWSRYATYSGFVYKTSSVWVSNWQWYDDYTGYYFGTVYKNVKQSFVPSFRISSDKYIVYFTDSNINNKPDIESVKLKGTAKVILVGNAAIKSQYTHDYFIDGSLTLSEIMNQINTIIADANPTENKQTVLLNEVFALTKSDYDDEGDPITDVGYQYVHDTDYYDNSMGQETGTVVTYGDSSFSGTIKTSFSKVGHYSIYRKIKDAPIGNASYSKDSNIPKLDIYVHRKPIADYSLDWDYNSASSNYKTTWIDKSYDLDHQYSDAQKGIRDRKIMYRKISGDNVWIYSIPDNLTAGTYELKYTVKDIEGVWSDEVTRTFTLLPEAPIQFTAELKAKNDGSLSKFAIGQDLLWYDVWSRFPYSHRLEVSLWDGATRVTAIPIKTINYSESVTAFKTGNDYTWNDITFNLPKGIGLQEKTYTARIEAISNSNASNKVTINRAVTLVNNTAPTVSFTGQSPSKVYEGDNIVNTITPIDTDGDKLSVQYYVAKQGQALSLYKTYSNVTQGIPMILDSVNDVENGVYQFRVVVSDGNGGSAQADKLVTVNPFGIDTVSFNPDPIKAGYWIEITVKTFGNVQSLNATFLNGKRKNEVVTLIPQTPVSNELNTFKYKYQVDGYEQDGNINLRFDAYRESRVKQTFDGFVINGSSLDQKAIIEENGR